MQACEAVKAGQAVPVPLGAVVIERVLLCVPSPQLTEHAPKVQPDTPQSTGHTYIYIYIYTLAEILKNPSTPLHLRQNFAQNKL